MIIPPTYLGMALSILGNLFISISLNIQKYAHIQNGELPEDQRQPYYKTKTWWSGMLLMALGEGGNFMAFSLAPVYLVAPLGAVSVVANAVLASKFLGEKMKKRDIIGVAMVVDGATIIVLMAPHSDESLDITKLYDYLSAPLFIAYICCLLVVAGILVYVDRKGWGHQNCVTRIVICSLLGSISVMCAKAVSTFILLTFQGQNMFVYGITYVMIVVAATSIVTQVNYLNKSMELFGASEVVPIYYVLFTLSSIIGGVVLYREFYDMGLVRVVGFIGGCILTFSGVYFITSGKDRHHIEKDLDIEENHPEDFLSGTIPATNTPLLQRSNSRNRSNSYRGPPVSRGEDVFTKVDRARTRLMYWCILQVLISTLFFITGMSGITHPQAEDLQQREEFEFSVIFGSIGFIVGAVGIYASQRKQSNTARYYLYSMIILVGCFVILAFVQATRFIFASCPSIEQDTGIKSDSQTETICQTAKGIFFVPIVLIVGITCPACCCAGCWLSVSNLLEHMAHRNRVLQALSNATNDAGVATQTASEAFFVKTNSGNDLVTNKPDIIKATVQQTE